MNYPVAIEKGDEKHAFGAEAPDLPGCFSAGDTLEEAFANVKEAIYLWIEAMLDSGRPIPRPSGIEAVSENPDYEGRIIAMIDVDLTKLSGKAERVNISLPVKTLRRLDAGAARAGKTRSGYLVDLICTAPDRA